MTVELMVHAGSKFALHQWLDARGLGTNVQDTDPTSPTFGEYEYTHTALGSLYYWNHPSGVITKSIDNTDPENPIVTNYAGFYARLSFPDVAALSEPRYDTAIVDGEETVVEIPSLADWVGTWTATSVLDGITGVGGEGITILEPEELYSVLEAAGVPIWGGLLGVSNQWSDPALWAFSVVNKNDTRDFNGVTWESTIDFNVWTPSQYPQGWTEIGIVEPPIDEPPAIDEWAVGVAYTTDDIVTYQGTTYTCRQSHTSIAGWNPAAVLALWLPQ